MLIKIKIKSKWSLFRTTHQKALEKEEARRTRYSSLNGCRLSSPEYGTKEELVSGFAPGGNISQKIYRDQLPPLAYDERNPIVLNVTIINAAYFSAVTGLEVPECPIDATTYISLNLPWFELYDEYIPTANNTKFTGPLSSIQSVAEMIKQKNVSNTSKCGYCAYGLAKLSLQPCGHRICGDCANTEACPLKGCHQVIRNKEIITAPMDAMEAEEHLVVDTSDVHNIMLSDSQRRAR